MVYVRKNIISFLFVSKLGIIFSCIKKKKKRTCLRITAARASRFFWVFSWEELGPATCWNVFIKCQMHMDQLLGHVGKDCGGLLCLQKGQWGSSSFGQFKGTLVIWMSLTNRTSLPRHWGPWLGSSCDIKMFKMLPKEALGKTFSTSPDINNKFSQQW